MQKLSLKDEKDKQRLIDAYTKKRSSNHFDIEKAEHILGFYSVLSFGDDLYYIEDLHTVVIFKTDGEKFHLYADLSEEKLLFSEIINNIASEEINEVIFHYTPDFEDIKPNVTDLITKDDVFHIRTSKDIIISNFKFPLIAHA